MVMNNGEIVLDGTPDKVLTHVDVLEECRLDIPFINKLKQDLKTIDIEIDTKCSLEEVADKICR